MSVLLQSVSSSTSTLHSSATRQVSAVLQTAAVSVATLQHLLLAGQSVELWRTEAEKAPLVHCAEASVQTGVGPTPVQALVSEPELQRFLSSLEDLGRLLFRANLFITFSLQVSRQHLLQQLRVRPASPGGGPQQLHGLQALHENVAEDEFRTQQ